MNDRTTRLLIVDEVAHSRESLAAYLQLQERLEIVGKAADAAEAINLAHYHQPNVVIMDVNLPDADGFITTERLSELEVPPAVILLTIHHQERDLLRAVEAGAAACIERSAGVDEILDTLHRLSETRAETKVSSMNVAKEI